MKSIANKTLLIFLSFISFISCDSPKKSENNSVPIETQYKNQIYGLWNLSISQISEETTLEVNDEVNFMRGERYNTIGTTSLTFTSDPEFSSLMGTLTYNRITSGSWIIENEFLITTEEDIKYSIHESVYDKDDEYLAIYNGIMENLQETSPKGLSNSFKILNIDSEVMNLKLENSKDPNLEFFNFKRVKN